MIIRQVFPWLLLGKLQADGEGSCIQGRIRRGHGVSEEVSEEREDVAREAEIRDTLFLLDYLWDVDHVFDGWAEVMVYWWCLVMILWIAGWKTGKYVRARYW